MTNKIEGISFRISPRRANIAKKKVRSTRICILLIKASAEKEFQNLTPRARCPRRFTPKRHLKQTLSLRVDMKQFMKKNQKRKEIKSSLSLKAILESIKSVEIQFTCLINVYLDTLILDGSNFK